MQQLIDTENLRMDRSVSDGTGNHLRLLEGAGHDEAHELCEEIRRGIRKPSVVLLEEQTEQDAHERIGRQLLQPLVPVQQLHHGVAVDTSAGSAVGTPTGSSAVFPIPAFQTTQKKKSKSS